MGFPYGSSSLDVGIFQDSLPGPLLVNMSNTHELFLLLRMQSPISKDPGGKKKRFKRTKQKKTPILHLFI